MKYAFTLFLLVIASLSNAQSSWEWVRTAGASADARYNDVATDGADNVYVTGSFTDSVIFDDGTKLLSQGGKDIFLAKYTPDGNLVWARSAGGKFYDEAFGIAVNAAGIVAVTGGYTDTAHFGAYREYPYQESVNPKVNVFVAKYTTDGDVFWVRSAGGYDFLADDNYGDAIAISDDGQVAVAGHFGGRMMFEGEADTINSQGNYDGFWAMYSSGGVLRWVHYGGGDQDNRATDIAIDPKLADVYVAGRINGLAVFHGLDTSFACFGTSDMFVTKVKSEGTPVWIHHGGSTDNITEATAITYDESTTAIHIGGVFTDSLRVHDLQHERRGTNGFLVTMGSSGHVSLVSSTESPSGSNRITSLDIGPTNALITTGIAIGTVNYGIIPLKASGGNYLFGGSLDTSITINKTIITNATDKTIHVAYSSNNTVYAAGVFRNSITLDALNQNASMPNVNQAYVAKLGAQNKVTLASNTIAPHIFPNPSNGIVKVTGEYVSVSIFDALGREHQVAHSILPNATEIDCHVLPNGIYIVCTRTALGEEHASRFSLQK
jgi:hypothetical protein